MNDISLTFEELTDPAKRDDVVAKYKALDLGGERYGVVCPVFMDETRTTRCNKRICPQGWAFANSIENAGKYCLHRENYDGTEPAEDITSILNQHGLPWRPLRTLTRMRENKPNKKKGKKSHGKEGQGSPKRSGNGNEAGRGDNSSGGLRKSGGHGSASGEVPSSAGARGEAGEQLPQDGATFGQYLDGKLPPSDGSSERARLFLARRERELLPLEQEEGKEAR